jgi:hypothetical protein
VWEVAAAAIRQAAPRAPMALPITSACSGQASSPPRGMISLGAAVEPACPCGWPFPTAAEAAANSRCSSPSPSPTSKPVHPARQGLPSGGDGGLEAIARRCERRARGTRQRARSSRPGHPPRAVACPGLPIYYLAGG